VIIQDEFAACIKKARTFFITITVMNEPDACHRLRRREEGILRGITASGLHELKGEAARAIVWERRASHETLRRRKFLETKLAWPPMCERDQLQELYLTGSKQKRWNVCIRARRRAVPTSQGPCRRSRVLVAASDYLKPCPI